MGPKVAGITSLTLIGNDVMASHIYRPLRIYMDVLILGVILQYMVSGYLSYLLRSVKSQLCGRQAL